MIFCFLGSVMSEEFILKIKSTFEESIYSKQVVNVEDTLSDIGYLENN